jgi:hypothetical protein
LDAGGRGDFFWRFRGSVFGVTTTEASDSGDFFFFRLFRCVGAVSGDVDDVDDNEDFGWRVGFGAVDADLDVDIEDVRRRGLNCTVGPTDESDPDDEENPGGRFFDWGDAFGVVDEFSDDDDDDDDNPGGTIDRGFFLDDVDRGILLAVDLLDDDENNSG